MTIKAVSLTTKIETNTKLTQEEIESAVALFGSRCKPRKKMMLRHAFGSIGYPELPHFAKLPTYGIYNRVMFEDNEAHYCAGQSYPDEIRTVRECLIGH